MTSFLDGPAAAAPQALMLKRSPIFLRVVFKPKGGPLLNGFQIPPGTPGEWDALDQPEDTPARDEILFAYQIAGIAGSCFVDGARTSGRYAFAQYRLVADQPDDATMRDVARWRAWCVQHAPPQDQY